MDLPFQRLEGLRISNVWLYDAGADGRWLIDTGHAAERLLLLPALRRCGAQPESLAGILLTHRHSDHAGNAAFLHERFGLGVWAHSADARILDQTEPRPRMPAGSGDLLTSLLTVFENKLPARATPVQPLEEGDQVAGLEVFWVPGHTEGSVVYWHAPSGALVSGDAVLNAVPPMAQREGLCLPDPTFSTDYAQACASLAAFHHRGLPYRHLLSGHGPMLRDVARARVEALLQARRGDGLGAPRALT